MGQYKATSWFSPSLPLNNLLITQTYVFVNDILCFSQKKGSYSCKHAHFMGCVVQRDNMLTTGKL